MSYQIQVENMKCGGCAKSIHIGGFIMKAEFTAMIT